MSLHATIHNELTRDVPVLAETAVQLFWPAMTKGEARVVWGLMITAHREKARLANARTEREREEKKKREEFFAGAKGQGRRLVPLRPGMI